MAERSECLSLSLLECTWFFLYFSFCVLRERRTLYVGTLLPTLSQLARINQRQKHTVTFFFFSLKNFRGFLHLELKSRFVLQMPFSPNFFLYIYSERNHKINCVFLHEKNQPRCFLRITTSSFYLLLLWVFLGFCFVPC